MIQYQYQYSVRCQNISSIVPVPVSRLEIVPVQYSTSIASENSSSTVPVPVPCFWAVPVQYQYQFQYFGYGVLAQILLSMYFGCSTIASESLSVLSKCKKLAVTHSEGSQYISILLNLLVFSLEKVYLLQHNRQKKR